MRSSDTWSFELVNEVFHNAFAIANNVDPAPQQLSLTLPVVPVGYVIIINPYTYSPDLSHLQKWLHFTSRGHR